MHEEIKPKVICKNLEDIIKESMFSTKRNSVEDSSKRQPSQRILKSEPRSRRSNERCNTSLNASNKLFQSGTRLNTSISKHSLASKQKINIFEASKLSFNKNFHKSTEIKKNKNLVAPTSAIQFYHSADKKAKDENLSSGQIPSVHTKSVYFNQIDAIFTQLEDFIRQAREKICLHIDFLSEENIVNKLTNELEQLSNLFKSQLSGLIQRDLYQEVESDVLKPKNRMVQSQEKIRQGIKGNCRENVKKQEMNFQQELIKIEEFMQRQNTINSTINSESYDDPYIPTETDAELLSMLVYKNKICSTKRKIQNNFNHGQQLMSPWVKSGRITKDGEGEYSFRKGNGQESKQKGSDGFNGRMSENSMKKKKNQHFPTQKSQNKENRQRSIYQMVLEENRKSKGFWVK